MDALVSIPSSAEPSSLPRGISRHDYGRTRGFLARVYQRDEGGSQRCSRRLFSYGPHGGEAAALEAARSWQAEQRMDGKQRKRAPGYGYVYRGWRSYRTASGDTRFYEAFIAQLWDSQGRPCSTSYGVGAHGEDKARALCYEWLERARAVATSGELLQSVG